MVYAVQVNNERRQGQRNYKKAGKQYAQISGSQQQQRPGSTVNMITEEAEPTESHPDLSHQSDYFVLEMTNECTNESMREANNDVKYNYTEKRLAHRQRFQQSNGCAVG